MRGRALRAALPHRRVRARRARAARLPVLQQKLPQPRLDHHEPWLAFCASPPSSALCKSMLVPDCTGLPMYMGLQAVSATALCVKILLLLGMLQSTTWEEG